MNDDATFGLNLADPTGQPRKRKSLAVAEKNQIYQFHKENPLVRHRDIAAKFGVERSTVSKIVHQSHYAATQDESGSAWEPGPIPPMTEHALSVEGQLLEWVHEARRSGTNITREMIRAQAAVLANKTSSQFLQPLSTTSLSQTPSSTTIFNPGTGSTLASFPDQAYVPELSLTEYDLELLARSCDLTTIQEEECPPTTTSPITTDASGATMQNGFLQSLLDHSGPHNPALNLDLVSPLPQTYDKVAGHEPGCASTHGILMDTVCVSEARRAFDTVESYVSNSLPMTALDQLCLNHIRTCLYRH